ncbi:hypothetical protein LTR47_005741 [Exophiala xenobiotica]|nr:hypothetical protein LTR47_005741 [Exophiala xenobiotica]KAK5351082.1 hypothetical protein LTR61_005435 [Exophiala xenobiotica]KAK5374060.1 hypothetical protein LTS03_006215 [Exophiala xenobiotica]KAK5374331.1 hypothetical protein LTR11_005538 [Exophiala xenobiotica]
MTPTTSGGSSSIRSSISSLQYVSSPSSGSGSTSSTSYSYSIIVISSTTITLTRPGSTGSTTGGAGTTLTIITATPTASTTSSSSLGSYITTVVSNTIDGCGTASGSGIAGKVQSASMELAALDERYKYENWHTDIVISWYGNYIHEWSIYRHFWDCIWTAGSQINLTGSVSSVVGCGYIIATTGTFIGSAVITGCGYGSGSGTLTGTGTIWPAAGYGMMSIVSSGIVSGRGSFRGCGTLTGSGVFTATAGYTTTILAPATTTSFAGGRATKTVSVFVSYCATDLPGNAGGGGSEGDVINNIFGNNNTLISPVLAGANGTDNGADGGGGGGGEINVNQTMSVHGSPDNPLCNTCPNSVGICCPPTVECEDDDDGGKCPVAALEMSGNTINGYLIAQVMNSTAPVEGKRRVRGRARVRVKTREEKELEKKRDSRGLREEVQRRAGSGHAHGHGHGHGEGQKKTKKRGTKGTRRVHRKQF